MAGRETAGATTCLIVRYVRAHGGDDAVARLVASSGVPYTAEELEDEQRWFTYEEKIALFEAAAEVLADPDVTRRMGEAALQHRIGAGLRVLLRTLGSPRMLLSNVAKACPKFSTVASMDALELGRRHAVLSYRLHEPKVPHRLDCLLNQGLISVVGPLFGLPLLEVAHPECQVLGAPACVYRVRWARRRRLGRNRHHVQHLEEQVGALGAQLEALQSTAADLVSPDDLSEVLARIVQRAGTAVRATRFLLAVRPPGRPLEVHSDGLSEESAAEIADSLLAGESGNDRWIVQEVASAERRYGVIAALFDEHGFFEQEGPLFAAYARSAAAVLDAATALDEARDRARANEALLRLARDVSEISSPEEVAQRLAEAMIPVLGGGGSLVFLVRGDALHAGGVHGLGDGARARAAELVIPRAADEAVAAWMDEPYPSFVTAVGVQNETVRALIRLVEADALAIVPVRRREELLAVACVAFTAELVPFDVDALLERSLAVADYAGVALDNARLLEQLRHRVQHDELTGLANRAHFEDEVERALARAERDRTPVSILFVDVDQFKQANDVFGHSLGDRVLVEVARRLGAEARRGDVVARVGGDEFAVMLWGSDATEALAVAERVRTGIGVPIDVDHGVCVSASIGIAASVPGERFQELLRRADLAMYEAKRRGRNLCVVDRSDSVGVGF